MKKSDIGCFRSLAGVTIILLILATGLALRADTPPQSDLLSTPSEQGSPAFHRHLVRPGALTTYVLRVANHGAAAKDVQLRLEAPQSAGWSAELSEAAVKALAPGQSRNVILTVRPAATMVAGLTYQVKVKAATAEQENDTATVVAETSMKPKIYFVSIDSLDPAYLKLNAAGTGLGKDGDWFMPNLHRLMQQSTFYPEAQVHIISATDMNHFNYLAGTMTGTAGIALVGGFFFGFDDKGAPIVQNAANLTADIVRSGTGQHVPSLFNAAKTANPEAWTAFVSGKNWVPEMMRFPEFQIDRIIHGAHTPDFITPAEAGELTPQEFMRRAVRALLPGPLPAYADNLGNPAGLPEPQDRREQYPLARLMGISPNNFPPDAWTMDAALMEIANEDPDVCYILLASVDDAGHAFGSAFDLTEWDDRGTPSVADDVSKYDPRASRQGILNVVREADVQVGRLLDALEKRGTLNDSILVAESDHSMVTYYRKPLDAKAYLQKACPLSMTKDYFIGTAASVGLVFTRRDDPAIIPQVEKALEAWRVVNPITGVEERPVIVYNREEMKTGFDQATQQQWMLPREYYSEYYIEHRKPGEQVWADLLVLTAPHYKYTVSGFGLGNLGMAKLPFQLPEWAFFIGGHGSFETRSCLLMVHAPGMPATANPSRVYAMDVAPTLFRLQGWPVPPSVDGKGLPGLDPTLQP